MKKSDFLILAIVLAAAVFSFCKFNTKKNHAEVAIVQANGHEYRFSLSKDANYEVPGALGITKLEVKDGQIRITDSPCPHKTCVKQGFADTIACLPNKVIVTTETAVTKTDGLDAISQ